MASHQSCPETDRLPGWLSGTLSPQEQALLSGHLETCHDCQQTVESLTQLSGAWGFDKNSPDSSALRALVQMLQTEGPEAGGGAPSDGAVEAVVALLTPPQHADSLGRLGAYDVMEV